MNTAQLFPYVSRELLDNEELYFSLCDVLKDVFLYLEQTVCFLKCFITIY